MATKEKVTLTQEELDKLIAEKAAALVEEQKAEKETEEQKEIAAANAAMKELVTVRLPFDKHNMEPETVSVNGKTWMIERGKDVQVPRFIKETLDNAEHQRMVAAGIISEKEEKLAQILN